MLDAAKRLSRAERFRLVQLLLEEEVTQPRAPTESGPSPDSEDVLVVSEDQSWADSLVQPELPDLRISLSEHQAPPVRRPTRLERVCYRCRRPGHVIADCILQRRMRSVVRSTSRPNSM